MAQFDKRNISMMMDLYEMTMANGYFASQKEPQKVVFDVFYRKNPDQGGYAIFAGLEQVIEYVEECALGAWLVDEVLDVINYQSVDTLIKVDEFVNLAVM